MVPVVKYQTLYILSRSSYQTSYPLYAENLWENDGRTFVSGLLIFMVKDFTTSQFSVFNCRKNIINKRSNSLMPLWPQMEKTKRWKKRGKEGIEPLLLKYLSSYSWRWVSGNSQHSIQGVLCVLCTHTVYLWMGCVCLSMWRGREGERETEREKCWRK